MSGSNPLSFRFFQVCINCTQIIIKLGGMDIPNGPHFVISPIADIRVYGNLLKIHYGP
jgi:hypothetical protein